MKESRDWHLIWSFARPFWSDVIVVSIQLRIYLCNYSRSGQNGRVNTGANNDLVSQGCREIQKHNVHDWLPVFSRKLCGKNEQLQRD